MDWAREIFALIFVFGLLAALVWLSRAKWPARILPSGRLAGRLTLVDRLTLTPSNSLHLVRADARTFLLAVHSAGVVVLSELTTPEKGEK